MHTGWLTNNEAFMKGQQKWNWDVVVLGSLARGRGLVGDAYIDAYPHADRCLGGGEDDDLYAAQERERGRARRG